MNVFSDQEFAPMHDCRQDKVAGQSAGFHHGAPCHSITPRNDDILHYIMTSGRDCLTPIFLLDYGITDLATNSDQCLCLFDTDNTASTSSPTASTVAHKRPSIHL